MSAFLFPPFDGPLEPGWIEVVGEFSGQPMRMRAELAVHPAPRPAPEPLPRRELSPWAQAMAAIREDDEMKNPVRVVEHAADGTNIWSNGAVTLDATKINRPSVNRSLLD